MTTLWEAEGSILWEARKHSLSCVLHGRWLVSRLEVQGSILWPAWEANGSTPWEANGSTLWEAEVPTLWEGLEVRFALKVKGLYRKYTILELEAKASTLWKAKRTVPFGSTFKFSSRM